MGEALPTIVGRRAAMERPNTVAAAAPKVAQEERQHAARGNRCQCWRVMTNLAASSACVTAFVMDGR